MTGDEFSCFIRTAFHKFKLAFADLIETDELVCLNAGLVASNTHPLSVLPRGKAIKASRIVAGDPLWPESYEGRLNSDGSCRPLHSDAFYAAVKAALTNPEISSCVYARREDLAIYRFMATEQLRRAATSGKVPDDAFPIAALGESNDCRAWGGKLVFYSEGISWKSDLFINDDPRPEIVRQFLHGRMSTKQVLSTSRQNLNAALIGGGDGKGYFWYQLNR